MVSTLIMYNFPESIFIKGPHCPDKARWSTFMNGKRGRRSFAWQFAIGVQRRQRSLRKSSIEERSMGTVRFTQFWTCVLNEWNFEDTDIERVELISYYDFKGLPPLSEQAVEKVKMVLEKYDNMVQYECDKAEPPVCNQQMIRFNGINENGNETLLWTCAKTPAGRCKTGGCPYDNVVRLVLLVLKDNYEKEILIGTDGEKEDWQPVFEEAREFLGLDANWTWLSTWSWELQVDQVSNANAPTSLAPKGNHCISFGISQ